MRGCEERTGYVVRVGDSSVTVRLALQSACSVCEIKSACSAAKRVDIEVPVEDAESYRMGEEVTVVSARHGGRKAVILAYVVPMCLIVAVLCLCVALLGWAEEMAALAALGIAAVYYLFIYIIRKRVRRGISFELKQKS